MIEQQPKPIKPPLLMPSSFALSPLLARYFESTPSNNGVVIMPTAPQAKIYMVAGKDIETLYRFACPLGAWQYTPLGEEKPVDQNNKETRIAAMATVMVEARRAGEDVGELIAAALHRAAGKLGSAALLVSGRPGSWEADIIMRMAMVGGDGDEKRVEALSALFVGMGNACEDGGDVLSQAMGKAVDTLEGLDEFAGMSRWYHDLTNMGRQDSKYWDAETRW